jgi:hypothetical protein
VGGCRKGEVRGRGHRMGLITNFLRPFELLLSSLDAGA